MGTPAGTQSSTHTRTRMGTNPSTHGLTPAGPGGVDSRGSRVALEYINYTNSFYIN